MYHDSPLVQDFPPLATSPPGEKCRPKRATPTSASAHHCGKIRWNLCLLSPRIPKGRYSRQQIESGGQTSATDPFCLCATGGGSLFSWFTKSSAPPLTCLSEALWLKILVVAKQNQLPCGLFCCCSRRQSKRLAPPRPAYSPLVVPE